MSTKIIIYYLYISWYRLYPSGFSKLQYQIVQYSENKNHDHGKANSFEKANKIDYLDGTHHWWIMHSNLTIPIRKKSENMSMIMYD